MFDDSQTDQKDENPINGGSSVGSGAISDPSDNSANNDASEGTLVHPTEPPKDIPNDNSSAPSLGGASASGKDDGDLAKIKQQALEQLSPLVHKLDQNPEEKYKTLMMMVQASDNQDLLNETYEAAQKITDEKAKAEALLNIVNEINYFTQNG